MCMTFENVSELISMKSQSAFTSFVFHSGCEMADFANKVVIITGASSGIGAGVAELLAKQGSWLVLIGRNVQNLKSIAEKCKPSHGAPKPLQITADVTVEADVKRIIDETIDKFHKIDVLVNNAGILERGSIETASLEQFDNVMNCNVRSVFHLTKLAVPHLIASKGSIVNVSSVNGMRSFPGVLAYNMSKSALDQFTQCVALELADKGVRVNSVNPGVIVTNIHKRGGMDEETYATFLKHSRTTHALGRAGDVKEVAETIAFLASDKASFITGALLPVDGGRHAMCPR